MAFRVDKFQQRRGEGTVQGKRGTGQGTAAERTDVESPQSLCKSFDIAGQHFDIGQEMMSEIDWLRTLEVGITRYNDFALAHSQLVKRALKRPHFAKKRA